MQAAHAIVCMCEATSDAVLGLLGGLAHPGYDLYAVPDVWSGIDERGPVRCLWVPDDACRFHGFSGTYWWDAHRATSMDRALCAFCRPGGLGRHYQHVWFLEEDVFVPSAGTIPAIDAAHPAEDVLCNGWSETEDGQGWLWPQIAANLPLPLPWAGATVCAVRTSPALRAAIRDHARRHRHLFFNEALYTTLAHKAGLSHACPAALKHVVAGRSWPDSVLHAGGLFHPIKDLREQQRLRALFAGVGAPPPPQPSRGEAEVRRRIAECHALIAKREREIDDLRGEIAGLEAALEGGDGGAGGAGGAAAATAAG